MKPNFRLLAVALFLTLLGGCGCITVAAPPDPVPTTPTEPAEPTITGCTTCLQLCQMGENQFMCRQDCVPVACADTYQQQREAPPTKATAPAESAKEPSAVDGQWSL